jgi:hypothetical protein
VEQAADIGIVSYLLFKKDTLKFTMYCNQDCALFGDPDTKLRSSVLNRKGYLTKLQKTDPTGFEALAGKYGLITNHQQHLASPPAAATPRRQASPPPAHAPSQSSNKKKKARRSCPSTITVSSPPILLVHETMANPPPAARPRVGGGTSSFFVIGHSLFLFIIYLLSCSPLYPCCRCCSCPSSTSLLAALPQRRQLRAQSIQRGMHPLGSDARPCPRPQRWYRSG